MNETYGMSLVAAIILGITIAAFYCGTVNERMAKEGYTAYNLKGTSEIFWKKGPEYTFPQNEYKATPPKEY